MSEQQADPAELRSLSETLTQLTSYTDALKQSAGGFAYMLPAEWQGPAGTQFLATFELWAVTAQGLAEQSDSLQKLAAASLEAYEGTIEGLDTSWSTISSDLGA